MNDVRVLITMDVEPVKQEARWTGPRDLAESEHAIQAYWDVSAAQGYPVSFFIHPEIAGPHRDLFERMEQAGGCLGLHIHSTKFQYPRYRQEFGFYSPEAQREMLADASAMWADAFGRKPRYFRPGAFSANDYTFPTLVDMGFRGGSLSVPGRIWPQRYCVWAGAEPDPHRAHAHFRHVRGDLEFGNIPLSVNFEMPLCVRGVPYFQDLRPTARGVDTESILRGILARIVRDNPAVPVVHVVAHNDQPFEMPDHESRRRMETVARLVGPLCEEFGLRAVGATVADVVEATLREPKLPPHAWTQSNDVE